MKTIDLIILGMATWRLASFLVSEKGPFNLFSRLREWVGIQEMRLDDKPEVYKAVPDTFLGQLLDCVWCCSVWIGISWTAVYYFLPEIAVWLALPLALSALAIGIESLLRKGT